MLEIDTEDGWPFGNIVFANDVHGTLAQFSLINHCTRLFANTDHSCVTPVLLPRKTASHQPQPSPQGAGRNDTEHRKLRNKQLIPTEIANPRNEPASRNDPPPPPCMCGRRVTYQYHGHRADEHIDHLCLYVLCYLLWSRECFASLLTFVVGHLLQDKDSQVRALKILRKAQSNFAALTPPGTNDRLRRDWGWDEDAASRY
jgi:hypothetical protein